MPLTETNVLTALRDCFDPEVKLNLVDLGLIYDVKLEPDTEATPAFPRQKVKIRMTLTSPSCPDPRAGAESPGWNPRYQLH
jgi:metal-sulfur cluster biosynthetic enzyme